MSAQPTPSPAPASGLALALRLGRVSNLPTVWTNALVGAALAGGTLAPGVLAPLLIAMSLFYVGGMYLNDAFDRDIDAVERPERPIPSGQVGAATVFAAGFGFMAAGALLLAGAAMNAGHGAWPAAVASAIALGGAIVAYDSNHKGSAFAPLVMALCRALVYVTAALTATGQVGPAVGGAAVALFCYTAGLTYVASRENLSEVGNLWPLAIFAVPFVYCARTITQDASAAATWVLLVAWCAWALSFVTIRANRFVPGAVVRLIAGISLLDAALLASHDHPGAAALAVAALPLTRLLQRFVPGT